MTDEEHERKRVIDLIERLLRRHRDRPLLYEALLRLLRKVKNPKLIKKDTTMIDYAMPAMMAEKALKDLHDAMLENRYDAALEYALQAIVESKLAYHAIIVMQENDPHTKAK